MTTADQLNDLRRRILAGEEPSREELRSAIQSLTAERIKAHTEEKPKGKKAPSVTIDLGDLL